MIIGFMRCFNLVYICFALALFPKITIAQAASTDHDDRVAVEVVDTSAWRTVKAGTVYTRNNFHQWLWGRNRRTEWATPVEVPVLWLDTTYGGLKPYKHGGGNESRSLRLRSANGQEYTLRSISKSRTDVIPPEFRNTFVERIIQDGVSMQFPYAATALPVMQQQAGIYHALPMVVYLPRQNALDSFNSKFENDLYLFEQRPDGDWSSSANMGSFKNYIATDEVIDKILNSNQHMADQHAFAKARLFDMLVADWDRHEDNWRWGVSQQGDKTIYIPVPRDRDQAFYTHNGFLLDKLISAAGLGYMENFDYTIKDVRKFNESARHMDRFFTNSLTQDDWLAAAHGLQQSLTDSVIAQSIRQLPQAIYNISGKELIEKLKSRRDQLPGFATAYYRFLSKEVAIAGSNRKEYIDVKELDSGKTAIAIYRVNDNGQKENDPYFQRVFRPGETKEVRIFGINGQDEYHVEKSSKAIKLNVYDTTPSYKYKWYKYNYKGFGPDISYNNNDRLYVGIKYKNTKNRWNKDSLAVRQYTVGVRYSISQNAFAAYGKALYPELIGKWDLSLEAEYDAIRWTNFYGTGNETVMTTKEMEYYRMRSREWLATIGLSRRYGNSRVSFTGFFQDVKNIDDSARFVSKVYHFINPEVFEANQYGGLQVTYAYTSLNDSIVPTKGIRFLTTGTFANNFYQDEFFQKYEAHLRAFLPITRHISFAIRGGGGTVVNDAVINSGQQYQHVLIGGGRSLRGYRRERFWGQTAYYNQNELRFITDFRSRIFNGKIGVFGFFDNGRVWIPGQSSDKIHTGYGPGILLSAFNKISATITYSMSEELRTVQLRIDSKF